jgi:hypothetical protein
VPVTELRPDNAPICPISDSTSGFTFVTLRGGGLFVVDSKATPMRVVAEHDQTFVHGNGCLGAESPGKMYIDSGGGTTANLYQADLYVFPLSRCSRKPAPPNTPRPTVVFNESDQEHADAHGAALARQDRFFWIADRGRKLPLGRGYPPGKASATIPRTPRRIILGLRGIGTGVEIFFARNQGGLNAWQRVARFREPPPVIPSRANLGADISINGDTAYEYQRADQKGNAN